MVDPAASYTFPPLAVYGLVVDRIAAAFVNLALLGPVLTPLYRLPPRRVRCFAGAYGDDTGQ